MAEAADGWRFAGRHLPRTMWVLYTEEKMA